MSSPAGWYPDPGGQRGMFRYWDGDVWSAQLSATPQAAPPSTGLGQGGTQSGATGARQSTYQAGGFAGGTGAYTPGQGYAPDKKKDKPVGLWIGIAVGVIVFGLVAWLVVRMAGGGGPVGANDPGSNATTSPCPTMSDVGTPIPHPNDGRVHGGMLSFPRLGAPWGPPKTDLRVAYGRDVSQQDIVVEDNYQPGQSWVAAVLVGELVAGDGFFSPEQGSEIVVKCLVGAFYGDSKVDRTDQVNQATTVDGKDAWLVETHLTFDIKGLKTKGELAIILIVATSAESSSLFYASIPDTSPQYVQPARDSMAALKVGA